MVIGRLVGVDYGTRRIGLALSDPRQSIASPMTTIPATGRPAEDAAAVRRWGAEHEAAGFVVGLPLNMDGSESAQSKLTKDFATALARLGRLPVELFDERLTSFAADERLRSAGARRTKQHPARDALAAQLVLQSFLDTLRRPQPKDRECESSP